jgi:sarcosine oxidase subunit gamma
MVETAARRVPDVPAAEWLIALPPAVRFAFYGGAAARAAAQPAWGPGFSEQPCRAMARGTRATLWLGPDEYLLLDSAAGTPGLGKPAIGESGAATLSVLEDSLAHIPHSLVDISHRQFALQVIGPHATAILSGACPLDLDLSEFPVGMCTRTVFAKADIVLWRTQEAVFHVEVWRSFAAYVTGVLGEIASEFHPPR